MEVNLTSPVSSNSGQWWPESMMDMAKQNGKRSVTGHQNTTTLKELILVFYNTAGLAIDTITSDIYQNIL